MLQTTLQNLRENLYPARWNFLQRYHADFLDCKNNWCNQRWPTPGSNPHPSKLESRTSAAPDMFWMTLLNGIEHVHTTNVSKMPMYNTLSKTHESFQNINSHHKGLIRHYSSLAYPGHINENPASEWPFGRWESTALSRKMMASQCLLGDAGSKISYLESPRRCIKAELIRPQNDHFWWISIAPQVQSSRKPVSYIFFLFLEIVPNPGIVGGY